MFDMLTEAERHELNRRLYSAGHKFAEVSHVLAACSLAHHVTCRRSVELWRERDRYAAAMTSMHELAEATASKEA